jgi:hypothetical protein
MKYTVDTINKIIEIESMSSKELKKLCKKHKGYMFVSKSYPIYWNPPVTIPYNSTDNGFEVTYNYPSTSTAGDC